MSALEDLFKVEGAWISDESCVCDFVPREFGDRDEDKRSLDAAYRELGQKLGIELERANIDEHRIVQIAHKLKQRDQHARG